MTDRPRICPRDRVLISGDNRSRQAPGFQRRRTPGRGAPDVLPGQPRTTGLSHHSQTTSSTERSMLMPAHPNSTRRTAAGRSADPAGRLGSHGRLAGRRHHRRRRDRRSPGAGGRLGPAGAAGWACRRGGGRLAAGFCVPRDTRVARRRQGRAGRRWHAPPAAPARLGRGDAIPHGIPPCSVEPGPGGKAGGTPTQRSGAGSRAVSSALLRALAFDGGQQTGSNRRS
jgi:hypothetical protein